MSVMPITPPAVARPVQSHNALTDMPSGLTRDERKAYVRGYGKGCVAYVRKNGGASMRPPEASVPVMVRHEGKEIVGHWIPAACPDVLELARITREHETARHQSAHRAGLTGLRGWLRKYSTPERLAAVEQAIKGKPALTTTGRKATTRKGNTMSTTTTVATRKPTRTAAKRALTVAPAAPTPAPEVKPDRKPTLAERKAFRRELAAKMRAAGVPMTPENWEASKAAGKPVTV